MPSQTRKDDETELKNRGAGVQWMLGVRYAGGVVLMRIYVDEDICQAQINLARRRAPTKNSKWADTFAMLLARNVKMCWSKLRFV